MMKVFVVPSWHPTPRRPLWANWILPHIDAARAAGVEVHVLQLGLDGEPAAAGEDPWARRPRRLGEDHWYVPVPQAGRWQRNRLFYKAFLNQYVKQFRRLLQLGIETWGRPDVLHAHVSLPGGYVAALVGSEAGLPVVVQEHYTGFESDARFWWRAGSFVREMGRRAQGFYAVSPGFARRIERTGLVRVSGVLPNPIDTELFRPAGTRRDDGCFRIVTAGNMDRRKGTDLLFEALRRLPAEIPWRLTLFGSDAGRGDYARWLSDRRFASRVSLPGKVSQKELREAYCRSDLYVVSSRIETANVSMLQAMACGVPVVSTRCGAPETLLDESVALTAAPDDAGALSQAVLQAARGRDRFDPRRVREFVVNKYSVNAVAEMIREVYRKAKAA